VDTIKKAGDGFLSTLGFRSRICFSYPYIEPVSRVDGRKKKPHQKEKAKKGEKLKVLMDAILADERFRCQGKSRSGTMWPPCVGHPGRRPDEATL
jgi:hypothetical protein